MNYDWILFDADNTLFDFDGASKQAFSEVVKYFNLTGQNLYSRYSHFNHLCWTALENGQMTQVELRPKRFELFFEDINYYGDGALANRLYLENLVLKSQLYPESRGLIQELKKRSYKLGIITNGLKEVQRPRLKHTGIYDEFDVIVVSDEIGYSKPDSRFFDYAFANMDVEDKSRVLVVGDSLNSDIKGGNNYGLDTVWYNPNHKNPLLDVRANHEIYKLSQLMDLI